MRRSLGRMRNTCAIYQPRFAGEIIDVQLRLHNRSWLPLPWLQIQEAVPLELKDQATIAAWSAWAAIQRLNTIIGLACKKRGYYQVGPLSLRSSDLFGFVEARWDEASSGRR
jgi:uncharacterized protein (DUF58 family)